jgi:molybdopterin synthase sulfur carrier subunit
MKDYLNKRWSTVEIPAGGTMREVIFELSERLDVNLIEKFVYKGELRSGIKILVNGRNISFLQGLDTVLEDRDVISILPIAGGG